MTNINNNTESVMDLLRKKGVVPLLEDAGISLNEFVAERIARFLELVRKWNKVAGLVSEGDLTTLLESHLIDSLSLGPVMSGIGKADGFLLDVGSGGGFPAIPLRIILPKLTLTMIERSERKAGFLIKAIGDLGISGSTVRQANFPESPVFDSADVITARAVEKPGRILKQVTRWMPVGCVFLVQSGRPRDLGTMFHVEHVQDEWQRQGLRRGELYLVRRLD